MKPKKIVFLILLILSPAFVWAQNLDGTIKIAVTNSGDRLILPIVLTTNNYKEETHDSSTLFFMQLIYIQVQKKTFDWIENYLQRSINEVDSERVNDFTSFPNYCAVYRTNYNGFRDYFMLTTRVLAIPYLEKLNLELSKQGDINEIDKQTILKRLERFIYEMK